MKSLRAFFLVIGLLPFAANSAMAATQTIAATMSFDTVLTVQKLADISFGLLQAGQAGTYTIAPSGTVSASNGGIWLGGATQAGQLNITGSTTQSINVTATNYTANNGVVPSAATCAYGNDAAMPCSQNGLAAPGTGTILKIGATVTVDGTQAVSASAAPTFDVVVQYN